MGDAAMRMFWPTKLNTDLRVLTRLGRVCHWIGTILAAILVFGAIALAAGQPSQAVAYLTLIGGAGLVVFFIGRALRYVLSAE